LVVVLRVVIPWFSGLGYYGYSNAYGDVLGRPWLVFVTLVTPIVKVRTVVLWLAPFLFLPLLSPLSVLLVPFALERFLSMLPGHWGTSFHYSAPLAPILVMSAADGLARVLRSWSGGPPRLMGSCGVAAIVVLAAFLPGRQPMWRLFSPARYAATAPQRTAGPALALIPPEASVAAPAAITPHLSQRQRIHILEAGVPATDFIISNTDVDPWPLTSETLQAQMQQAVTNGYRPLYEANGWTVLRRDEESGFHTAHGPGAGAQSDQPVAR
jgi:uncharacterized membrane protein